MKAGTEKCDDCKTGKILLNYQKLRDNREISKSNYASLVMNKTSEKCVMCIYNGIGKYYGKAIKKLIPSFKTLDLYEFSGE